MNKYYINGKHHYRSSFNYHVETIPEGNKLHLNLYIIKDFNYYEIKDMKVKYGDVFIEIDPKPLLLIKVNYV